MRDVMMDEWLQQAIVIAKQGGECILEAFQKRQFDVVPVDCKDNQADLVTATDRKVEDMIKQHLKECFPDHRFIGEESTYTQQDTCAVSDAPVWIVDPVDGTTNFVYGLPFVCVSIGLCIQKEPILGVVYNPILNELYHAVKGQGAYLNGIPLHRFARNQQPFPMNLSHVLIATEYGSDVSKEKTAWTLGNISRILHQPARGIRSLGSAAMQMCFVARGSFDMFYEAGIHVWDICAGIVIVREAGGRIVSFPHALNDQPIDILARKILAIRPCLTENPKEELDRAESLIQPLLEPIDIVRDDCVL